MVGASKWVAADDGVTGSITLTLCLYTCRDCAPISNATLNTLVTLFTLGNKVVGQYTQTHTKTARLYT